MKITLEQYSRAVGVCRETARLRLKNLSYTRGRAGKHEYLLAEAVLTLRPGERNSGAARNLVMQGTYPDEAIYVGGLEAEVRARNLNTALTADENDRFQRIRCQFFIAVANSTLCVPVIVENLDVLGAILILQPDVLNDVLTGSENADVSNFAVAFSIVNNSANYIQEAA